MFQCRVYVAQAAKPLYPIIPNSKQGLVLLAEHLSSTLPEGKFLKLK